ncbi:MAG TPA: heavy metal-binding domain-containing protein [Pyrinomonadaceae bacterium]|nr:heavy metal-binding domain-containing protein [Pyrinomonadaceae bacterium]
MRKRMQAALVSLVSLAAGALSLAGPAEAARCDGHHQCQHKAARRTTQRSRAARQRARRDKRRAVAYVCPMHPDIRERARGTCPKCLMDLVAEPRGTKAGEPEVKAAGAPATGGR